ncbi:hypothetical protein ABZY19_29025 [Streptomyces sp. NPDC006475]|uniref:hypothetical protein n=1 Tax=Streptomyces sp. NPDC006475 TaxID=3155719 RepID=UPI0033AEE261
MRLRLRAAVLALLADPALAGVQDAARLSAVVLFAKARAARGRAEDNVTSIRGPELGRWLGMTESTVHHAVLPTLRKAGVVRTRVVTDEQGQATGLDCVVMPLWKARRAGGGTHPLCLSKVELATLLRLLEALFGPGWAPKGKAVISPGLLAGRRGKGAATDRLGLLLMVLNTRASGWLQLCGGSVVTREGRGAATVARLLACSPAGARKVLARLTAAGVVGRERKATVSRMNGRGRVKVLPVAQAYERTLLPVSGEGAPGSGPVFADRPDAAVGDHGRVVEAGVLETTGMSGAETTVEAEDRERPGATGLHADHASVATLAPSPELSCGFSGHGRQGGGRGPERAGARENQTLDTPAVDRLRLAAGETGPLRREQPQSPSISSESGDSGLLGTTPPRAVVASGQGRLQWGRVPEPPADLQTVLAPVRTVWERLRRPAARRLVEAAARAELVKAAGFAGRVGASEILADRLSRRLEEQLRVGAPIASPVGWLVSRALPQRQECGDQRCDEGVLVGSGRECVRCEDRRFGSRARRRSVAAAVDETMPNASPEERRTAAERQLNANVRARAWAREYECEQVRARTVAVLAASAAPVAPIALRAPRPTISAPAAEVEASLDDRELVLEDLTRDQVLGWRSLAARDHQVVHDHIERYGEVSARRLFTNRFVDQVTRLSRLGHLSLGDATWERS